MTDGLEKKVALSWEAAWGVCRKKWQTVRQTKTQFYRQIADHKAPRQKVCCNHLTQYLFVWDLTH